MHKHLKLLSLSDAHLRILDDIRGRLGVSKCIVYARSAETVTCVFSCHGLQHMIINKLYTSG